MSEQQNSRRNKTENTGYSAISRFNHWIVAIGFLAALMLGLVMEYGGLEREAIGPLMNWHKALGVSILIFGLWRVGWRLVKGFPDPIAGTPRWQAAAAKAVHWILLVSILLMPVSGITMTLAEGRDLQVWGVTLLPALPETEWLDALAGTIHSLSGLALCAVVALHIGAALKHHWIDRDWTLIRMARTMN